MWDLSNAGYQSRMCNEWHRKTLAHNTVCWNGQDITSVTQGQCLTFTGSRFVGQKKDVYEGIDYQRTIDITDNGVQDLFQVSGKPGIYDYVFHLESGISLSCGYTLEDGDLGFRGNGYQHIVQTRKVLVDGLEAVLQARIGGKEMKITIALAQGQELYLLKTKDNPVNQIRNTILIRGQGEKQQFQFTLEAIN